MMENAIAELALATLSLAERFRQHTNSPPELINELESIARGLRKAHAYECTSVVSGQEVWKLSPNQARREVSIRLAHQVHVRLASVLTDPDGGWPGVRYHRTDLDGAIAGPELAGKRIGQHHMTARCLVVPLPFGEE